MLTTPVNSGIVKQVIYPNNVRGDIKKEPILNFSDYDLCPKLINYLSPMINGVRMFDVHSNIIYSKYDSCLHFIYTHTSVKMYTVHNEAVG